MPKNYQWLCEQNGKIAIGGRPSLQLIELLKSEGCSTVITLLKESEKKIAEMVGQKAESLGMHWIWFPLTASNLPSGEAINDAKILFKDLQIRLNNQERIFIHCAAGIHRTGSFTNGLLRFMGNSAEESREKINQIRPIILRDAHPKHWAWGEQFGE
jgi:predicted protein tyrosine phosphatase